MIALHGLRESQPRHAVSCSALLFLSGQLLTKLCLSSHFLCHYFLQEPKQTCSLTETHQPQHQKKRHRKNNITAHKRHRNTNAQFWGEKRQQLSSLSVFLPFFPTLIFLPHTAWINPEGFFSWDPGQRVKDTRCSRLTVLPALHRHLCSSGAGRLGGGLKFGHTRACECPGVGSTAVRLPGASLVQGLIFPHNGSTDWT